MPAINRAQGQSWPSTTTWRFWQNADGSISQAAHIEGQLPTALGQAAMAASLPVVIASDQSTVTTDVEDRIDRLLGRVTNFDLLVDGTLEALNETVELAGAGLSTVGINLSGTWVGTVVAEGTVDGTNWATIPLINATMGSAALSTTANGTFLLGTAGYLRVRLRMSVYTSGTADVYMEGTSAPAGVFLSRSLPTGNNTIGAVTGPLTDAQLRDSAVAVTPSANALATVTATIANAGSLSAEVDLGEGRALVGIIMPDAWTAAVITFQSGVATGVVANLYQFGAEVSYTVDASQYVSLQDVMHFYGARYVHVRSGTAAAAVAQGAERAITLVTARR